MGKKKLKLTQKKSFRRYPKKKGGSPKASLLGASSGILGKSLGKSSKIRRLPKRTFGIVTYANKDGKIVSASRTNRGKKSFLRPDRTTNQLTKYKDHRTNRFLAAEKHIDEAERKLLNELQKKGIRNSSYLEQANFQLGKIPFNKIKPKKVQDDINKAALKLDSNSNYQWNQCKIDPKNCSPELKIELLSLQKNNYDDILKTYKLKNSKQIESAKKELTKKKEAYEKMKPKIDSSIIRKRANMNIVVNNAASKQCQKFSRNNTSIKSTDCLNLFNKLRLDNPTDKLSETISKMKKNQGYEDFNLTVQDVSKVNTSWYKYNRKQNMQIKRRSERADSDPFQSLQKDNTNMSDYNTRYNTTQKNNLLLEDNAISKFSQLSKQSSTTMNRSPNLAQPLGQTQQLVQTQPQPQVLGQTQPLVMRQQSLEIGPEETLV